MAWYRTGTISVTNGSTTVTGSGTSWIAGAGIGEALYAPDGRIYEIANIASNTSLTLATAYLGATQSGQSYTIIPSQSYIRDLAADASSLISQYAGIASGAGAGKFTDGSAATPGIAFSSDVDTGIYRASTNTIGISAGGVSQMTVNTSGANIPVISNNPTLSAGTANGVLYLNGSKVATSGSALTFDGGNLGLGITPSAWSVGEKVFEIAGGGHVAFANSVANYTANAYYNAGYLYKTTAAASKYAQFSGNHAWYTAPSGTAGNPISFTQAMTLDASGNLGIGTTSPGGNTTNRVVKATGTTSASLQAQSSATTIIVGAGGGEGYVEVSGVYPLEFIVNGSERARIDSSGNLLVGTTSATANVSSSTGTGISLYQGKQLLATNDGDAALLINRNGSNGHVAAFRRASITVGSISVTASATTYNTSSDYRLKNITGPITTSGAYIDSLNPVEGTWKADGSTFVGLIAHEVQEVSRTQVATGEKDGEQMQAMDYSNSELIANLIAEVQSLRKRLAILEAK